MLPYADIIDIQDYSDFKFPSYLPNASCGKSVGRSGRNCSLAKLNYLRWFAEKSNIKYDLIVFYLISFEVLYFGISNIFRSIFTRTKLNN